MNEEIYSGMLRELKQNLLEKWYPLSIDREHGGYYSNISAEWEIMPQQDKMVVTQSRHIWTLSKAYEMFNETVYKEYAYHGYRFLRDFMWDREFGGFYQIRNREGGQTETEKYYDEKRTYGNAFAVYALSSFYRITKDKEVLDLAVETFKWIENHAHDPLYKGYYQFLTHEGKIFNQNTEYKTKAKDFHESNFKDQNSSIHLLEAYTELYTVWPDTRLREKLNELLILIRDVITDERGYLRLFFRYDWTPVSFVSASKEDREKNYCLDHISFGHDYETAFLMLETSHKLNLENDTKTFSTAKRMLDHAISNGWDDLNYGFFDEGYYLNSDNSCTIVKDTKTWWPQAEGLNVLLIFSQLFPGETKYGDLFLKLWKYIGINLIDDKNGGWYYGSLEKEPHMVDEPKGNIWKACYHDGRALMNCVSILNHILKENKFTDITANETYRLINHWKPIADNY